MTVATVKVRYVNGRLVAAASSGWPALRPEGVDYVDLCAGDHGYRMQGQSIYWSYSEGGLWVVGGGTVTDVREVMSAPDGFELRHPEHMPDLTADRIKLGWWEP